MNRSPSVDPLEEALSRPPHLEGSEFTIRVLQRLPARRARVRAGILAAGATLSTCLAAALLARSAGALGPALVAALQGTIPDGSGWVAALAVAALGSTAALTAAAELGREPGPGAA